MALAETIGLIFFMGIGFFFYRKGVNDHSILPSTVSTVLFTVGILLSMSIPFVVDASGQVMGSGANIMFAGLNLIFWALSLMSAISNGIGFIKSRKDESIF